MRNENFIHRPAESCNGELYKKSDTASITQLKRLDNNNENTLRFYKHSPDSYNLQIRTYKGIGEYGDGKPRNMIANIHVSKEDIQALMDYVKANPPF